MPEIVTRYGRLAVLDTDTDIIGRFLSRYGEWAWCEASFVASMLQDGARVLDVGAFAGTFGLGVALSRSLDFLCFVEANPVAAHLLEGNVRGKTMCPVVVVEAMVAGPEVCPRVGRSEVGNLGSASFRLDGNAENTVSAPALALTLADLRMEHGAFDLIKLDIEGMELEALQGDAAYLANGRTTLWIECNEDYRSLEVARLLLSWKLELFYFAFPSYNPDNFNGNPKAVFPLAFEAGLLAAPRTNPRLTTDLQAKGCILKALHSVDDLRVALWRTPRWGMSEWEDVASGQELAALVGRSLREESFDTFLKDAATAPVKATIWQRLEAMEAGLKTAHILLDEERGGRTRLEDDFRRTSELAIARQDETARERRRREGAEAGLRKAEMLVIEEQERASRAEGELASACARALGHLSALGQARERGKMLEEELQMERAERVAAEARRLELKQTLEARLHVQEKRALTAEHALNEIWASTMWRVGAPARAFVGGKPALRALLRRGRVATGSVLRRWRR